MLTVNLDKALHDLGRNAGARTDYKVFTCLTEYMDTNGVVNVPQTLIAKETGYSRRTVSNSLHRLQEKGFLTIEQTMANSQGIVRCIPSNLYHIAPQYLMETETVVEKEKEKSMECPYRRPDYAGKGCSYASQTTIEPRSNDVRRLSHDLTRLHDVLVDVVADILLAAETKEIMK